MKNFCILFSNTGSSSTDNISKILNDSFQVINCSTNTDEILSILARKHCDILLIHATPLSTQKLKSILKCINVPHVFLLDSGAADNIDKLKLFVPYGFILNNYTEENIRLVFESACNKHNVYQNKLKELQRTQQQLESSNNFLESIINNANVWISVLDTNRIVSLWNPAAERITGYSKEEIIGVPNVVDWFYDDYEYNKSVQEEISRRIRENNIEPFEIVIKSKSGKKVHLSISTSAIHDKAEYKNHRIVIAYDITELKQKTEQLNQSLNEKEILLKEIHHRVKNNLQIINSLINLQVATISDETVIPLFRDAQHRVKSMALIHEKLYQTQNFSRINFKEYIEKLTKDLFTTFDIKPEKIKLEMNCEDISFSINTSIALGLIINEIITNTLKYAFPGDMTGNLFITLQNQSNNRALLIIGDDGKGMQKDFNLDNAKTLGLQLIQNLSEQISANVKVETQNGVRFFFDIPIS